MSKSAFVRARLESGLKLQAEHILEELGITPTQAITMLYRRIVRGHEWPLELKIPNEETLKTFQETDSGTGLVECKDKEELFRRLGIESA